MGSLLATKCAQTAQAVVPCELNLIRYFPLQLQLTKFAFSCLHSAVCLSCVWY